MTEPPKPAEPAAPRKSWVPKPIAGAIDWLAKYPLIVAAVVLGGLFAIGITLASGAPGYGPR